MVGWPAKAIPRRLERALDEDHVPPFAIEQAMPHVRADHPESPSLHQADARLVRREQLPDELVEPPPRTLVRKRLEQGGPHPTASQDRVDVHAALCNAGIYVPAAVLGRRRPAGYAPIQLGDQEWMPVGPEPGGNLGRLPLPRLKRGGPLADPDVVDVCDCRGV